MNIASPFPFSFMMTIGWLGFFLMIGVFLRSKVSFFKKYLIPSCIIGGFIGMLCNMTGIFGTGSLSIDPKSIEALAFHFFGLYFAATALNAGQEPDPCSPKKEKHSGKRFTFGAFWLAGAQYTIQQMMTMGAVCVMLALNFFFGYDYIASTAQLLTSGFSSGPGPAMTMGKVWDDFLQDGRNLSALGLTTGSLGFLFAYIIGIPLANYYHRKRKLSTPVDANLSTIEQQGYYEPECGPLLGKETTHSSNVDSLAFQFGVVFFIYLLAGIFAFTLVSLLGNSPVVGMIWGLFFLFPLITGLGVKALLKKMGYFHLINQKLNNRIMGGLIDFIVLSSFFGIVISNVQNYLYFLIFGIFVVVVILLVFIPFLSNFTNNFREERILYLTGLLTGTAATGLFLIRIIDPEGKSPLPMEVALSPIFILLLAIPLTPIGYMEVMFGRSIGEFMLATGISIIGFAAIYALATKLLNKSVAKDAPEYLEK